MNSKLQVLRLNQKLVCLGSARQDKSSAWKFRGHCNTPTNAYFAGFFFFFYFEKEKVSQKRRTVLQLDQLLFLPGTREETDLPERG